MSVRVLVDRFLFAYAPGLAFDDASRHRISLYVSASPDLMRVFTAVPAHAAVAASAARPAPARPSLPPALLSLRRYGEAGSTVPAHLVRLPGTYQ